MGTKDLRIDQLLLDLRNPRIGLASNQREALQRILKEQGRKLVALAEDISKEGLSPMDRILVMGEENDPGLYTVLEGNRRVAALKLLTNPHQLADMNISPNMRKRFESMAHGFNPMNFEPIPCYEVNNRTEANKWILLRHTGANDGRGVVTWSSVASRRFQGEDPALQALDFVVQHGGLSEEQKKKIEGGFPVTTLDRLLSTKDVREAIGVEIIDGKLKSGLPGEELIKPLRRLVIDLAEDKINVSQLKNKGLQVEYINSLPNTDKPDLTKRGDSRNVADFGGRDFSSQDTRPSVRRYGHQDPSQRKTMVPRSLKLNITQSRIAEIFKELKTLHMENTPNACAVLLRVFLELSVDHYMSANKLAFNEKDKNGKEREKKLLQKVGEAVQHLISAGNDDKNFKPMLGDLNQANSPLHIDLLNRYVHNRFQIPKHRDIRIAWDHSQPFFEKVWQ